MNNNCCKVFFDMFQGRVEDVMGIVNLFNHTKKMAMKKTIKTNRYELTKTNMCLFILQKGHNSTYYNNSLAPFVSSKIIFLYCLSST